MSCVEPSRIALSAVGRLRSWGRRFLGFWVLLVLAACGGGGGGSAADAPIVVNPTAGSPNVASIAVERGPGGNVNIPYVSVTLCVPGTSSCRTIDHILVDTGSTGLRIFTSTVQGLPLPAQTVGASSTIFECANFLDIVAWGPVKVADIAIAGERATSVPLQLMADPAYPTVPSICGNAATQARTVDDVGANGILGVSVFYNDGQTYFNCAPGTASGNCQIAVSAAKQVQNPVASFAVNNNGVMVQLPLVPSGGATRVDGFLVFGIDTQPNNQLGTARVVKTDASGFFTTVYKGRAIPQSFMDSGSNGLYFNDTALTRCSGAYQDFYCPNTTQNFSATITLANGNSDAIDFAVGNANTLLNNPNYAFADLAGDIAGATFDWGLPFFYGRRVFVAIEGRNNSAGAGPMLAYTH